MQRCFVFLAEVKSMERLSISGRQHGNSSERFLWRFTSPTWWAASDSSEVVWTCFHLYQIGAQRFFKSGTDRSSCKSTPLAKSLKQWVLYGTVQQMFALGSTETPEPEQAPNQTSHFQKGYILNPQ